MSEISKIKVDDVDYDIKDASARQSITEIEADNAERDKTISAQGTEIGNVKNDITNFNNALTGAVGEINTVKGSVEGIGNSISGINAAIDKVEADITEINERIDSIGSGGSSGGSGEPIDVSGLVLDMSVMDAKMFEKFGDETNPNPDYFFSRVNWDALQVFNRAYVQGYDGDDDLRLGDGGMGQYALKAICRYGSNTVPRYPWLNKDKWVQIYKAANPGTELTDEQIKAIAPEYTDYPYMGTIAERQPDGNIRVPNPTNYYHAVNKGFMDASLNKIATADPNTTYLVTARKSQTDHDNGYKASMSAVTRMTKGARYGGSDTVTNTTISAGYEKNYESIANTVPTRTVHGNLRSGEPKSSNDVVTLGYFNANGGGSGSGSGNYVPLANITDGNRYVYSATGSGTDTSVQIAHGLVFESSGVYKETLAKRNSRGFLIAGPNNSIPEGQESVSASYLSTVCPASDAAVLGSALEALNLLHQCELAKVSSDTKFCMKQEHGKFYDYGEQGQEYRLRLNGFTNKAPGIVIIGNKVMYSGINWIQVGCEVECVGDGSNPLDNRNNVEVFCYRGAGEYAEYGSIASKAFKSAQSLRTVVLGSVSGDESAGYSIVKVIGAEAFLDCDRLSTVIMDNGVEEIHGYAFAGCSKLASINLSKMLWFIGESAFATTGLFRVTIPESVTRIGKQAFSWCPNLRHVEIDSTIVDIGVQCFSSCPSLTSVTIKSPAPIIPNDAFVGCNNLKDIYVSFSSDDGNATGSGAKWGAKNAIVHYSCQF